MALIPLKQTIRLERATGQKDAAGKPIYAAAVTLNSRVVEEYRLVRNKTGAETSASVSVYLDKLTQIGLDDRVTYTDENARTRVMLVISYEVLRDLGGKPFFTIAYCN